MAAANNFLVQDLSKLPNFDVVKQANLDQHNLYRSELAQGKTFPGVYGRNIQKLAWSDKLAQSAQEYANQCKFDHPGGPFGENLAYEWHWAENNVVNTKEIGADSVDKWQSETEFFKGEFNLANENNKIFFGPFYSNAGHYTQMMWDDTTQLGCGIALCNTLSDSMSETGFINLGTGFQALITVCRYTEAGNFPRNFFERGFDASAIASKCDNSENGLCVSGTNGGNSNGGNVTPPLPPVDPVPPTTVAPPPPPPLPATTARPTGEPVTNNDFCDWNPEILENVDYQITNFQDGGVLDIPYGAIESGSEIHNYCCHAHGGINQRFQFQRNQDDCSYNIVIKARYGPSYYAIGYQNGKVELVHDSDYGVAVPADYVRWTLDEFEDGSFGFIASNRQHMKSINSGYLTPNMGAYNYPANGPISIMSYNEYLSVQQWLVKPW